MFKMPQKMIQRTNGEKTVLANGRTYSVLDDAGLSLVACPQTVEELLTQWDDDNSDNS